MPDVFALKGFYETELGRFACRKIRQRISELWREPAKEKILGIGFALPYLPLFSYGNSCTAFMPAKIGAMKIEQSLQSVMVDDKSLPSRNDYFDLVIIIHEIEACEIPEKLIAEIWRVMKPAGKLIIIAPNDGGMWQRFKTPFHNTKAYSKFQLVDLLISNKFSPKRFRRALFGVPTKWGLLNRASEVFGRLFLRAFCGVLIIEAEKLIFAAGGRPIKIAPTIWDKIFKPKPVAVGASS